MTCCNNCFADKEIIGFIFSNSTATGTCETCATSGAYLVDARELEESFQPLISLFKPIAEIGFVEGTPKLLHEKLQDYWKLFRLQMPAANGLLKSIMADSLPPESPIFIEAVEIEQLFTPALAGDLHEKKWDNFAQEIKTRNRFFLNESIDLKLLNEMFKNFAKTYKKGKLFYRSRISESAGHIADEMGKPPGDKSSAGRANPKGIPYLYVSTEVETTVYESRSTYLDYVSVAEIKCKDELTVVSLRGITEISPFVFGDQIARYLTHQKYLVRLEQELSKPIRKFDKELDYLPSQYLCEYVKSLGYDGIEYGSSFKTNGINLAIFNDEKLEIKNVEVYEVTDITLKISKISH